MIINYLPQDIHNLPRNALPGTMLTYIARVKQVVIITNDPGQLAVEFDGHSTTLREHIKQLRMGPQTAAWFIESLYKVLMNYTDEIFTLTAPSGKTVLAIYRDTRTIWIEGTNTRF